MIYVRFWRLLLARFMMRDVPVVLKTFEKLTCCLGLFGPHLRPPSFPRSGDAAPFSSSLRDVFSFSSCLKFSRDNSSLARLTVLKVTAEWARLLLLVTMLNDTSGDFMSFRCGFFADVEHRDLFLWWFRKEDFVKIRFVYWKIFQVHSKS